MRMMNWLVLATACSVALPAAADYAKHPKAKQLFADPDIAAHYSRAELRQLLTAAQRVPSLIESEQKAPERSRSWESYRAIFLQEGRINNGVNFMREHAAALAWAQQLYGPPPAVITAIIGVETLYGGYTGPHRVLDSLATQGFDHPRRQDFFFSELRAFLLLCKERGLDPLGVQGSYAGAMGLPQFMPSNYRRLAVDFDHDGSIDLWTAADAIGSAARYLAQYRGPGKGWRAGAPVALPISIVAPQGLEFNARAAPYRWEQISDQIGLSGASIGPESTVGLLDLPHPGAPRYWLSFENFYSLMSYNPRTFYAMAVFELSEAIALRASTAP